MEKTIDIFENNIIDLFIVSDNEYLYALAFEIHKYSHLPMGETKISKEVKQQLKEYFNKERKVFDINLKLDGTEYQEKVWNEVYKIPFGQTRSYKDIAIGVNNPRSYRAVGNANNKNKIPIIIPCHRVIGNDGKLAGYGGGIDIKVKLLELEGYHD